ncbi:MAG TPA: ABC transporter permease [Vicinamibacterales bacterium]
MLFDVRLALRSLGSQPGLSAVLILTIGLAVAVNTALFSIFDGLLFRPLPFPSAERIVHIDISPSVRASLSREQLRRINEALDATPLLELRVNARPSALLEEGAAEVEALKLRPVSVTADWYRLLGVVPVAGTLPGAESGVMIGEDLWRTRYGADTTLIGKPLDLPGLTFRRRPVLLGVLPRHFSLPDGANLWFGSQVLSGFNYARLADGVSIEQVRSAIPGVTVTPLREHVRPDGAFALGVLLSATGLLLLVAWVQVAALLFSRAAGRASEIGVRLALGASRFRLVRQYAAEGLCVIVAALALAWALTPALTSGVVRLLPESMTRGQLLDPDMRALAFAAGLSITGVLLLTLVPLDIVRRSSPLGLIRGSLAGRVGIGAARVRSGLLVAQLAVTAMLLYMSALALHSFDRITSVDLGFEPANVAGIRLPPVTVSGATNAERRAHLDRQVQQTTDTFDAIGDLPGVQFVAGGPAPFFESALYGTRLVPVTAGVDGSSSLSATIASVTPDYPRVLGLRVIDGRVPADSDLVSGSTQAIVNETLARQLAEHGPVIGQTITAANSMRVAAVVADFSTTRPDQPVLPQILMLSRRPQMFILAKLEDGPGAEQALAAIRTTFERIWPDSPEREIISLPALAERAVADYRARATLLSLIGLICLPLAVTGIAGALSYATRQRTREIGIRMALGAEPGDILRAVGRTALSMIVAGTALGVAGGILMGRAMSAYLFGVRTADPPAILGTAALLLIIGWLSALLPARRAARILPAAALRDR